MDEPFSLRFLIQPLMAFMLGFRDGKRDAKEGLPYYALSLLTARTSRKELLLNGLHTVALPLCIAIILDGIVQVLVAQHVVLWNAVVVGISLIGIPYIATRGLTNRISSRNDRRRRVA